MVSQPRCTHIRTDVEVRHDCRQWCWLTFPTLWLRVVWTNIIFDMLQKPTSFCMSTATVHAKRGASNSSNPYNSTSACFMHKEVHWGLCSSRLRGWYLPQSASDSETATSNLFCFQPIFGRSQERCLRYHQMTNYSNDIKARQRCEGTSFPIYRVMIAWRIARCFRLAYACLWK